MDKKQASEPTGETMNAQAPEGWYPDPDGQPEIQRWWTGTSWTGATRHVVETTAATEASSPAVDDAVSMPARAARPSSRRRLVAVAAGVAAVVVIVAGVTLGLVHHHKGGDGGGASGAEGGFTVSGTITVDGRGDHGFQGARGDSCHTMDGYSDIKEGMQVVLNDDEGKTVGVASLSKGVFEGVSDGKYTGKCVFGFSMDGVPERPGYYSLEAGRRGSLKYTRGQLASPVDLSLGD